MKPRWMRMVGGYVLHLRRGMEHKALCGAEPKRASYRSGWTTGWVMGERYCEKCRALDNVA